MSGAEPPYEEMKRAGEISPAQKVTKFGSFVAGGLAACFAVTATNPIELVKTRMQLQGELSTTNQQVYKNPVQAMVKIFRNEGIVSLQKGLLAAYVYQIALNGSRLGLYEPLRGFVNSVFYPNEEPFKVQNPAINVFSGAFAGVVGAVLGSPLYMVKTRLQSYSATVAIGEQTRYNGVWDGLKKVYNKEGVKGLFRGTDAAMLRTGVGSAVQLPIYNVVKEFIKKNELMREGTALHLTASTVAGFGVGIAMNPWDVILTRIYNQKGDLYKGPIDCFIKTVKFEGPAALYKGFQAQIFRIAPHTILCLTIMEQTMKLVYNIEQRTLK